MMRNKDGSKMIYLIIAIITVVFSITGATYAYWTARTSSVNNAVQTASTIYSISMDITPLYNGFSFIPMNDADAIKGLRNKCLDKYGRGACAAYNIRVYDYKEDLNFISGFMNIVTDDMENLSYMMYRISDEFNEDDCVLIEDKSYCVSLDANRMVVGEDLSLGDSYEVTGSTETEFILLIWLSNLNTSQNDTDIGKFTAIVTMQAGNGGEIKGSIASMIKQEVPETGEDDTSSGDVSGEQEEVVDEENMEGV